MVESAKNLATKSRSNSVWNKNQNLGQNKDGGNQGGKWGHS
jgi:hypothetical protein